MTSRVQTFLVAPRPETGNTSYTFSPSRKGKGHFVQVVAQLDDTGAKKARITRRGRVGLE
jgi:hypothetical protein